MRQNQRNRGQKVNEKVVIKKWAETNEEKEAYTV